MLIDWFTVGAQILNFIILVWLMKRFLYQPILNAIDAREKRIADELANANKVSQEAQQAKAHYENIQSEFDKQRDQLLVAATEAANVERQILLKEVHKNVAAIECKNKKALKNKMQELHLSIRSTVQKELFSMVKKALYDLASVDLEAQMIVVFLHRLRSKNNEQQNALKALLKATQITIQSSIVLPPDKKSIITSTLTALLGKDTPLQFEQSSDLICGIELTANGFKIGWSVAEYLHSLENSLSEQINKQSSTHTNFISNETPSPSAAETPTKQSAPVTQSVPKQVHPAMSNSL